MKKAVEKGRKIFRKICIFFGAAAITMMFAACYGMPPDCDEDCDYPCCKTVKDFDNDG